MSTPRETCFRCLKPRALCVCAVIPRVEHRTPVIVLQHPREWGHAIGTARFVGLGLARARVEVARGGDAPLQVETPVPAGAGLLYPGPGSRDLAEVPDHERPSALVVLDGTWSQVKTLRRANPWLDALPSFHLAPTAPSRYRIRREPSDRHVSTLEAVVLALRILEPETRGLESLLDGFDAMIDAQIERRETRVGPRRIRLRASRPFVGVPRALGEDYARLVLVDAAFTTHEDGRPRRLVQWVAVRGATGERFERLVRPEGALAPKHLEGSGLSPTQVLERGVDLELAASDFRAFVGDDIVGAWSRPLLERSGPFLGDGERFVLRAAYTSARGLGAGPLATVIAHEGLVPVDLALTGAASTRLAHALAVANALHDDSRGRAERRTRS